MNRHLPKFDLPTYAYHPGFSKHPESFPGMDKIKEISNKEKQAELAYLYGWDLANHQFHWEAHEAWELSWNLWGRNSKKALIVQGLIFLTAARLKFTTQHHRSSEKLLKKAKSRLLNDQITCTELGFSPENWLKNWDQSQIWLPLEILPSCFQL